MAQRVCAAGFRSESSAHSNAVFLIGTLEKGVGQIRLLFLHCEGKSAALSLEGLTVGALIHGGVRLVGADLNGAQTAVVHVLAVVRAARHIALDRVVGSAAAAVVRTILAHRRFLPER